MTNANDFINTFYKGMTMRGNANLKIREFENEYKIYKLVIC
jgi:hypothetical protein